MYLVKRAFELCRVGDRNLSHSSLTSPTTLAALHDLPHTNSSLHQELSAGRQTLIQSLSDDEPAFLEAGGDIDEGSDIPVDIVRSVVMSEGTVAAKGYTINTQGSIIRDGIAEDAEDAADVVNLVVAGSEAELGHRRQVRRESKRYSDDWEGY
ncbi:hypothetical protein HWV62_26941 [Athelia sp. TMB]|nr:hypothetical protein HWV62_26941 [Athelia sp. TMB]